MGKVEEGRARNILRTVEYSKALVAVVSHLQGSEAYPAHTFLPMPVAQDHHHLSRRIAIARIPPVGFHCYGHTFYFRCLGRAVAGIQEYEQEGKDKGEASGPCSAYCVLHCFTKLKNMLIPLHFFAVQ